MQRFSPLILAILATLLFGAQSPAPVKPDDIQHELNALTGRGLTYRMLDSDHLQITNPIAGETCVKSMHKQDEAQIRSWAASRGVPVLEINPALIDTNQYAGWYNWWTEVPLSNEDGMPLVVGDFDGNGKPEVYGVFKSYTSSYEARAYEIDSTGVVYLRYNYIPRPGGSQTIGDADNDSLNEVLWIFGGGVYDYEQDSRDSLPIDLRFRHERFQGGIASVYTQIFVGFLDSDSLTDLLYKGSEPDSTNPNGGISKVYVAEYNADSTNFVRVWSKMYVPGTQNGVGGFAVDDFDGDGKTEFVVCDQDSRQVFVTENTGNNEFQQTWSDSTPIHYIYYLASGDVDGDGRPEFFVGAGDWTLVYEADGDNIYSLKFLLHLLAGGGFYAPTYLTHDIDGDGQPDLIIQVGSYLHVFKGSGDNNYRLFFLKRVGSQYSVQVYDLDGDGRSDFLVSRNEVDSSGHFRFKADAYRATSLVNVGKEQLTTDHFQLLQNYPNPFNPSTMIRFELAQSGNVRLAIYDILGRKVAELANGFEQTGPHSVSWNAAEQASGIYLVQLDFVARKGGAVYSKLNKSVLLK